MRYLFIFLTLTACATKPPDITACVEMSISRGECVRVVSGQRIRVDEDHKLNGKTWWEMRPTNIILPLESWIDLKKFIIKTCKNNKNMCDKEISSWDRSIQHIDDSLTEKGILQK